jgi:hypothetical protein
VRDWLVAPGSEPGLARVVKRVAALTRMKRRRPPTGEIEILPGDRLFLIDVSLVSTCGTSCVTWTARACRSAR